MMVYDARHTMDAESPRSAAQGDTVFRHSQHAPTALPSPRYQTDSRIPGWLQTELLEKKPKEHLNAKADEGHVALTLAVTMSI
jgi:hypothetical protein